MVFRIELKQSNFLLYIHFQAAEISKLKHTKLIDDPWQKVLKFGWIKAKTQRQQVRSQTHKP
jgi:hypothetical protein